MAVEDGPLGLGYFEPSVHAWSLLVGACGMDTAMWTLPPMLPDLRILGNDLSTRWILGFIEEN